MTDGVPALAGPPEVPAPGRGEVRLWLRLLTCTTTIEAEIRRRLRRDFGVTLPRFDVMAALDRSPEGLTLSEVSKRMMVSNGNLTGLVERLVASGHVHRRRSRTDRRAQVISLTETGRADFRVMARAHEGWIAAMLADLPDPRIAELTDWLGRAKASARKVATDD